MDDFDTSAAANAAVVTGKVERVVVSPGTEKAHQPGNSANVEGRPKSDTSCCAVDRLSHSPLGTEETDRCYSGAPLRIRITDSQKTTDSGGTYVVYCVEFKTCSVKRRYSDFESLQGALITLNPSCIIPPIPEKHTIGK